MVKTSCNLEGRGTIYKFKELQDRSKSPKHILLGFIETIHLQQQPINKRNLISGLAKFVAS